MRVVSFGNIKHAKARRQFWSFFLVSKIGTNPRHAQYLARNCSKNGLRNCALIWCLLRVLVSSFGLAELVSAGSSLDKLDSVWLRFGSALARLGLGLDLARLGLVLAWLELGWAGLGCGPAYHSDKQAVFMAKVCNFF